jgi:hypothetical protein
MRLPVAREFTPVRVRTPEIVRRIGVPERAAIIVYCQRLTKKWDRKSSHRIARLFGRMVPPEFGVFWLIASLAYCCFWGFNCSLSFSMACCLCNSSSCVGLDRGAGLGIGGGS